MFVTMWWTIISRKSPLLVGLHFTWKKGVQSTVWSRLLTIILRTCCFLWFSSTTCSLSRNSSADEYARGFTGSIVKLSVSRLISASTLYAHWTR